MTTCVTTASPSHSRTRYAGIDPGRDGALVIVGDDGLTAIGLHHWTDCDVPPTLTGWLRDGDVVAIEEQYVGPGAHASLALAQWTGRLLEQLPDGCTVLRPLATTWRAKVLRRGRLRRRQAKRLAIEACIAHAGMDPALSHNPDVAEAWCMARYAWGWARAQRESA